MTDFIDRTQEPDEAFTAMLADFDAAPTPPEVLREQLARELWAVDAEVDVDHLSGETPQRFYRLADAALAVFRDQQDPAVQRVLELIDPETGMAAVPYGDGQRWFEEKDIRAAIGGDGR